MEYEKLYYSISEVADRFKLNTSKLRYWESQFPHLLPKRKSTGARKYTAVDIQKIEGQPRTEAKPQQPLGNDVFSALKQDPIFPSIEVAEKSVPIGTKYKVGNKFYRKQ